MGGVSRGRFESLNLGSWVGDDPAAVETNWQRARAALTPFRAMVGLSQVHGTNVHVIGPGYNGARLVGDGAVTAEAGIMLGIFTADCVPLLMIDPERRIAGALHAGWRGTLDGIVGAGLHAMIESGAEAYRIRVALGPAIGPCCYEVDEELGARFARRHAFAGGRIRPGGRTGKVMLDLRGILTDQLVRQGVRAESIWVVGPCTQCANERFFSRRAAGGESCGLQLSLVGFTGDAD